MCAIGALMIIVALVFKKALSLSSLIVDGNSIKLKSSDSQKHLNQ